MPNVPIPKNNHSDFAWPKVIIHFSVLWSVNYCHNHITFTQAHFYQNSHFKKLKLESVLFLWSLKILFHEEVVSETTCTILSISLPLCPFNPYRCYAHREIIRTELEGPYFIVSLWSTGPVCPLKNLRRETLILKEVMMPSFLWRLFSQEQQH